MHDLWLIIRHTRPNKPPTFFLTHGRNYSKFDTSERKLNGYNIAGHNRSRADATALVLRWNEEARNHWIVQEAADHINEYPITDLKLFEPKPQPHPETDEES